MSTKAFVTAPKTPLAPIRALGGVCARNYLSRLSLSTSLGSANIFKDLADCYPSASNTCPINVCGQRWTIRFASGPRLEGGRLGTNAPIVEDVARFETGTRKCGLMKNPHSRRPAGARSRQVIG